MNRLRLAALAALLTTGLALPAAAEFDPAKMTEAERAAFGEAVRAYLMENPQVLIESINVLEQRKAQDEAIADRQLVAQFKDELTNDGHSWVGGNLQGDLTVVEFIDYRCGVCRSVFNEIEDLVKTDGNIRIIYKEFPILGDQSDQAARFAIAVKQIGGDEAYKTAHDQLMTMRGNVTPEVLTAMAGEMKLDAAAVMTAMKSPEVEAVLAANQALGQKMNLTGTPAFVIGDELLRGVPRSGLQPVVDQARKAAAG